MDSRHVKGRSLTTGNFHIRFFYLSLLFCLVTSWEIWQNLTPNKQFPGTKDISDLRGAIKTLGIYTAKQSFFSQNHLALTVRVYFKFWPAICNLQPGTYDLQPANYNLRQKENKKMMLLPILRVVVAGQNLKNARTILRRITSDQPSIFSVFHDAVKT